MAEALANDSATAVPALILEPSREVCMERSVLNLYRHNYPLYTLNKKTLSWCVWILVHQQTLSSMQHTERRMDRLRVDVIR